LSYCDGDALTDPRICLLSQLFKNPELPSHVFPIDYSDRSPKQILYSRDGKELLKHHSGLYRCGCDPFRYTINSRCGQSRGNKVDDQTNTAFPKGGSQLSRMLRVRPPLFRMRAFRRTARV